MQSPRRASANGMPLERLGLFCSYLSPLCFFPPSIFCSCFSSGVFSSSFNHYQQPTARKGPRGVYRSHPLLVTRLRGTRLESTGTVCFLEGQPGALVAAAPRFKVSLLGLARMPLDTALVSPDVNQPPLCTGGGREGAYRSGVAFRTHPSIERRLRLRTNQGSTGLRSIARNNKATRLFTRPGCAAKSSAKDLSLRTVKLQCAS